MKKFLSFLALVIFLSSLSFFIPGCKCTETPFVTCEEANSTSPSTSTPPTTVSDILTDKEKEYLSYTELSEIDSLSAGRLLTKGKSQLTAKEALKAKVYFKGANYKIDDLGSDDQETTRFFYALTRSSFIAYDHETDGTTGSYTDFGDLLDSFGCGTTRNITSSTFQVTCPEVHFLPSESPALNEIRDFLYDVARPELEGVVSLLSDSNISSSFYVLWEEPFGGSTIEIDYADALVLRSSAKATLSWILMLKSYNLTVDLDSEGNNTSNTHQSFLSNHTGFLTLDSNSSTYLSSAKTYLTESVTDMENAIASITAESDTQTNDWLTLSSRITSSDSYTPSLNTVQESRVNTDLAKYKECLASQCTLDANGANTVINADNFFSGQNANSFLPSFSGNSPTGYLPDTSFGGIITSWKGQATTDMNLDSNGNGVSDELDKLPVVTW